MSKDNDSFFEWSDEVKEKIGLKIGLVGASGSGKTYSAFRLAKGLCGSLENVGFLDTENKSSLLYRKDFGRFKWKKFEAPFTPERYAKVIEVANKEKLDCLIIDSISDEWEGEGGLLDMHGKMGGRFQDWAKANPHHAKFLNAIQSSDTHIITCCRAKQGYSMDKDSSGRNKVDKVGLAPIQRDGFEYKITCNFLINSEHNALADKDRTGLFNTDVPFRLTEETGAMIKEWNT